VSLTTDSWTSRSTENYIAVMAHYITAEWEMGSYILECFQYSERHTAELRVIREWKLEGKVVGVCTDIAANITAAVKASKSKTSSLLCTHVELGSAGMGYSQEIFVGGFSTLEECWYSK